MRLLPCLLLLLPLVTLAAGGQWKWRDANGQLQYSDRPPPAGTPEKDILQRPQTKPQPIRIVPADQPASKPAPQPPTPAASTPKEREAEAEKKRKLADDKSKKEAAEAQDRQRKAENCEQARARLAEIDSGQRMASTNARGEREFWDDARRAAERQRVQAIVSESCR